jgi:phosphonate degradation associated HDIG domain protein
MAVTSADILELDPAEVGPGGFCDTVLGYLEVAGQSRYDETVSQLEHGLQCAALAERAGCSAVVQVAALLHDLGHLVLDEHDHRPDFLTRDRRHEVVGARLATRWFGPSAGAPIALHVAAKRYLVHADPAYRAGLSPASVRSLRVQGGPMSAGAARRFRALPHADAAVALRRWDDLAKVAGARVPGLPHWRPALLSALAPTIHP